MLFDTIREIVRGRDIVCLQQRKKKWGTFLSFLTLSHPHPVHAMKKNYYRGWSLSLPLPLSLFLLSLTHTLTNKKVQCNGAIHPPNRLESSSLFLINVHSHTLSLSLSLSLSHTHTHTHAHAHAFSKNCVRKTLRERLSPFMTPWVGRWALSLSIFSLSLSPSLFPCHYNTEQMKIIYLSFFPSKQAHE